MIDSIPPSNSGSLILAELLGLHEIIGLGFVKSEEQLVREAVEKATRFFGVRYFAILSGLGKKQRMACASGFDSLASARKRLAEAVDSSRVTTLVFNENTSDQDVIYFEQTEVMDNRTRHLYTIFGRRIEDSLAAFRLQKQKVQAEEEKEKLQGRLNQAQKMESVGRLAGGVAHDFNNMLSIINGYAEMSIEMLDPADPLYENISEICNAGKRSANIVRQLLAFARQQTINPVQLDLNDTLSNMLKMLQRLIGENIDLVWRPGNNLWPVMIDPSQVDQIMANLAVNSRDAISDVGKLTIETKNTIIDEEYCKSNPEAIPGRYVMLAVSDDGCGMYKEIQERLFDPYFTTKEMGKGTGLGLPTIYGIITQNKGFVNVYSEPGEGTTFKIYLPSQENAEKASGNFSKEPTRQIPMGAETILIVEDEVAILRMARSMLEKLGYTVLTAERSKDALQVAEEYDGKIHLLMTDVIMPEKNGRDLSMQLCISNPDLKTLFMSGYTAEVIAKHGVLDEGVHFLQKPFSLKDLAVKVRDTIEQE